ncbi:MAG: hypothetical protein J6U01_09085 [Clostridia bacterium]|nr:hypothetical protein [Clostridia bacterium]
MVVIVGIQFQKNGALYYYDLNQLEGRVGDYVIVETSHGPDLGEVVVGAREVEDEKAPAQLKRIIRIATQEDIQHSIENREKERQAFGICQRKIAEHKLEMKLVSVEYNFDNSKILFFFTANGRIDFRSLVKDLASVFKTRIELRQIGVRDEARMLGGLGQCGRPICCGTFLDDFQPVSIKMAKEQNLSLNPTKISGVCGRLMCCLKYEQEQYEKTRKRMPKIGRDIRTPDGFGTVIDQNILKETVTVRFQNGDSAETKVYALDDLARPAEMKQEAPIHEDGMPKEEGTEAVQAEPAEIRAEPAEAQAEPEMAGTAEASPDAQGENNAEAPKAERRPRTGRPKNGERQGRNERSERKPRPPRNNHSNTPHNADNPGNDRNSGNTNRAQSAAEDRQEKPARPSKLGRPVRRENPMRARNNPPAAPAENAGRTTENSAAQQPAKEPSSRKNRSSQWAADLEKALNSIDKN